MAKVEIYTKAFCPYCSRAKRLLDGKGADYAEFDITMGGPRRAEMIERAGARGESTPSVRQVLNHIIAPLYHHAVFALPIDDEYATDLAADVMAMVR